MAHKTLLLHLDDSADEAALREKLRELPGIAHVGEWDDETFEMTAEIAAKIDAGERAAAKGRVSSAEEVHRRLKERLDARSDAD